MIRHKERSRLSYRYQKTAQPMSHKAASYPPQPKLLTAKYCARAPRNVRSDLYAFIGRSVLAFTRAADVIGSELRLFVIDIFSQLAKFVPRTNIRITEHGQSARPHHERTKELAESAGRQLRIHDD